MCSSCAHSCLRLKSSPTAKEYYRFQNKSPYTHTHTHTHTLSLSLSHTHTLSLSLTHTLSLTLSLTHTHTHTHTLSLTHTHTLSRSLSLSLSLTLSISIFNLSVLYWHDKNYTFVLPKQLQLGCSQVVHIWINRKKKKNNKKCKMNDYCKYVIEIKLNKVQYKIYRGKIYI